MTQDSRPVLVLGATGYIGGRLIPRLLAAGHRIRAAARSAAKLSCRPWAGHPDLEITPCDVLDPTSLHKAAQGCRAAYYLVHSMSPGASHFADADRDAARNMVEAAEAAGLEQIIYLGGLGFESKELSEHLRSRIEVGKMLSAGQVPCTWLRAAMILGSGSASFEILRYLADRLPIMITPTWVHTRCQPIAVSNVLGYLTGCLDLEQAKGQAFDIGGPDILTYAELFQIYAEEAGLRKRLIIPVPVLSPGLSSYWIHMVTPVPASLARPLAEGLRNTVVCSESRIREIIPQRLVGCREAVHRALQRVSQQQVETCWSDAGTLSVPEWESCGDAPYAGGTVEECNFTVDLAATPEKIWDGIVRIGGQNGWYYASWLWELRGFMDRLLGGVGLRRGRRDPVDLRVGDALDFWRVLVVEKNHRLQLLAEMKLPGEAIFELQIIKTGENRCELRQISRFLPRGLGGILYWQALRPLHAVLFKGMLRTMARTIDCPILNGPKPLSAKERVCALPPRK
jgi:uncharacterized protein YbjT (DUF2867 family)